MAKFIGGPADGKDVPNGVYGNTIHVPDWDGKSYSRDPYTGRMVPAFGAVEYSLGEDGDYHYCE
jgi:hypothetical protein